MTVLKNCLRTNRSFFLLKTNDFLLNTNQTDGADDGADKADKADGANKAKGGKAERGAKGERGTARRRGSVEKGRRGEGPEK